MKEKETTSEKTIVIDVKLTKGLVAALSCILVVVALLTYLTLTGESAAALETETAEAASTGMRLYYLTQLEYKGNGALSACAAGYHMASFWEIADPSNLKYNTSLGYMRDDSGHGPPYKAGWVRTGYASSGSNVAGRANCLLWASNSGTDYGTRAYLPSSWTVGDEDLGVWVVNSGSCAISTAVWCIED